VLAYLFWHRPQARSGAEAYEQALLAFHRSLHRAPPAGLCGSATFRLAELPWLATPAAAQDENAPAPAQGLQPGGSDGGYEDWYLVEDYAALGVLGEAAVGRGHRSSHDEAARRSGAGAGGLYCMVEGEHGAALASIAAARLAIWVILATGPKQGVLGELLGDGMDPRHASLWRRQLVLGPAPEFCLLAGEPPAGAAPTRLPEGWSATVLGRELLWSG
jgi:hypothetical protein